MKNFQKCNDILMSSFTWLFPLLLLLYSIIYIQYLDQIQWGSLLIFYLFLLANSFIENELANRSSLDQAFLKFPNPLIELINIALIISIALKYNIWLGLLALLYSIIIHIQYVFISYRLTMVGLALLALFKAFIPTMSLFQLHLEFVPQQFIRIALLFVLPIFMIDYNRFQRKLKRENILIPTFNHNWQVRIINSCLVLSSILALLVLWVDISWLALFVLFIPFLTYLWHNYDLKASIKSFTRQHFYIFILMINILSLYYFFTSNKN